MRSILAKWPASLTIFSSTESLQMAEPEVKKAWLARPEAQGVTYQHGALVLQAKPGKWITEASLQDIGMALRWGPVPVIYTHLAEPQSFAELLTLFCGPQYPGDFASDFEAARSWVCGLALRGVIVGPIFDGDTVLRDPEVAPITAIEISAADIPTEELSRQNAPTILYSMSETFLVIGILIHAGEPNITTLHYRLLPEIHKLHRWYYKVLDYVLQNKRPMEIALSFAESALKRMARPHAYLSYGWELCVSPQPEIRYGVEISTPLEKPEDIFGVLGTVPGVRI